MKRVVVAALLALAAVAATSFAYAAIPVSDGVISACTDNKGALKVIDVEAGQTCNGNQQLLAWSRQGPVGPAGPQGPEGPRGPSDGYFAKADVLLATDGTETTVSTLDLPAGRYLAFARVEILPGDQVGCELRGGVDYDNTILYEPATAVPLVSESATLMIPATLVRQDTLKVTCTPYSGDGTVRVWARISAIQVGNLTAVAIP